MMRLILVLQIVMGLALTVFGANGFFEFIPKQGEFPVRAEAFLQSIRDSGFLFPILCVTHIFAGVLLIIGRWVPLALVVHAPVTLNMVLFHWFLASDFQYVVPAYAIGAIHLLLFWRYREALKPLFKDRGD
ncbi:MAG: acyltransferase [Planctomycetota bacterium]